MAALTGTSALPQTLDQLYLKNIDASEAAIAAAIGTGASAQQVQGTAAEGAAKLGNPVMIGANDGTNAQALRVDASKNLLVSLRDISGTQLNSSTYGSDAQSGVTGLFNGAYGYRYNGATFDRERNNVEVTALASAARTANVNSADLVCYNGKGLTVVLDVTTAGTGSITITIQGKDPLSGKYFTLLAGAAVTTISTNVYQVGPGLPATANVSANVNVPRTYRVSVVHNNANSITYSIGSLESV